jgi:hypothetical protein
VTVPASQVGRPRFEIGDIVRKHGPAFARSHTLRSEQRRALNAIARCRTAKLGGHLDHCHSCGYEHPAYNSCRNRHCPKCQALSQERWIAARQERTLPTKHFHIVFTLPRQLRPLAAFRKEMVFQALLTAANATLLQLSRSRLDAVPGITAVLHTWTRDLRFHPHVHCIVTAGGLKLDGTQWTSSRSNYLFSVKVMGALFRGKMIAALRRLYRDGSFDGFEDFQDPQALDRLIHKLFTIDWIVYAKAPFDTSNHVFRYLGRYTHRVGIANSRLLNVTDDSVTFRTKNGNSVTLTPVQFLERLILHILPPHFVKIRHCGLHAPSNLSTKLKAAKNLLEATSPESRPQRKQPPSWQELLLALTGRDLRCCPKCGATLVVRVLLFTPEHEPNDSS